MVLRTTSTNRVLIFLSAISEVNQVSAASDNRPRGRWACHFTGQHGRDITYSSGLLAIMSLGRSTSPWLGVDLVSAGALWAARANAQWHLETKTRSQGADEKHEHGIDVDLDPSRIMPSAHPTQEAHELR